MTSRAARSRAALVVLLGVLGLAFTTPAHAADEVSLDHVQVEGDKVSLVVSTDSLPPGASVDPSRVTVEIDGQGVEARAKVVDAGDIRRATVLVVDASNSMRHAGRFAAAIQAVNAYLDSAPPDVEVGMVTFAGKVDPGLKPSTDHEALRQAMSSLTLKQGTAVYDGIDAGLELLGDEGYRSLLVLSDGGDTSSAKTLEVVTAAAEEAGVVTDVVSLAKAAKGADLSAIAEATGGQVIPADPKALGTVFATQAGALTKQLIVTFEAPPEAPEEASVSVHVEAGGSTFSDSAFVSLGRPAFEAPDIVSSGRSLVSKPMMLLGALALALGLAGLLAVALTGPGKSSAERRMEAYFGDTKRGSRKAASADVKGSAVAIADRVVQGDFEDRITQRLAGAGSALTAAEWLLLHAGIAVGAAVFGAILGGPFFGFVGLVLGVVGPWLYLKFRHSRRLSAFNGQLADTLGLMAGGLQAGLSLPQAVDSVVREGHEPIAGELRRALVEQRLGVDITDALDAVGERMESEDFSWVVLAIRIQREVGGNLAEILHTVADTLREREYLRRQVRALSAEGRLSGYILTALPPLIGLYMTMVNPEYISLLYTTVPGYFLLGLAAVLLAIGSWAMSKLSKVEV